MVAARGDRPTPTVKRNIKKEEKRDKYKPETASGYLKKLDIERNKLKKSQVESQTEEIERKEK